MNSMTICQNCNGAIITGTSGYAGPICNCLNRQSQQSDQYNLLGYQQAERPSTPAYITLIHIRLTHIEITLDTILKEVRDKK